MEKRKKVALIFIYLVNNLGDDLFLRHICLRYPNVDFYVMERNVETNEAFKDLGNVHFSKKMLEYSREWETPAVSGKAKKFFEGFDACVLLGGSIFMQFNQAWRAKLENFRKRMSLNKNTYIIGANFGPFTDPVFLTAYGNSFASLKDLCFRDSVSAAYFPDARNIRYAPDVLFSYKCERAEPRNRVAISLINGTWAGRPAEQLKKLKSCMDAYTAKMVELCSELARRGVGISLLSFCDRQGDLNVAKKIEAECLLNGVTDIECYSYTGNHLDVLGALSGARAVVATRFHAMVLGFMLGKAVYPIIYDEKQKYVLQDLNFYGKSSMIEEMAEADVKEIADCLLDPNSKNSYEQTEKQIEKAIEESELQFAALDKILKRDVCV